MWRLNLATVLIQLANKIYPDVLRGVIQEVVKEYKVEEPKKPTARDLVDSILDRPIEWVDWRKLPHDARKNWGGNAKNVLENQAFQAVFGKKENGVLTNGELVKGLIESAIRKSTNWQQVQDVRMTINGIELARELLEEMLFKEVEPMNEEPNSAI